MPCLRIEGEKGQMQWMYESSDIVRYLEERLRNPRLTLQLDGLPEEITKQPVALDNPTPL